MIILLINYYSPLIMTLCHSIMLEHGSRWCRNVVVTGLDKRADVVWWWMGGWSRGNQQPNLSLNGSWPMYVTQVSDFVRGIFYVYLFYV